MTGEPAFRTATKADTEAVLAVARGIWSEMGEGSGFTQEPTVDGLGALSAGEGGAVFVCELGGAIRGKSIDATGNSEIIASGVSDEHQPVPGDRRQRHCLATQGVADCDVPYLRAISCIDRDHVGVPGAPEQPP